MLREIESGVAFLTGTECSAEGETTVLSDDLSRITPATGVAGHFYSTDVHEHGTDVVPAAFAMLARHLIDAALAETSAVQGWTAVDAAILIQDFGVGIGTVTWRHDAPGSALDAPDGLVAGLTRAAESLLAPLVSRATRAVRSSFPSRPSQHGVVGLLLSVEGQLPDPGTVLWTWGHARCSLAAGSDHRTGACAVADRLCPNDYTVLHHRDHTYATGVAMSVTCSTESAFADGVALSRVLVRQDAWWALLWALDRALLALQMQLQGSIAVGSIRVLVARARQIEDVTARVQLLRSRVDSLLVSSGARELAVLSREVVYGVGARS